MKKYLKYTPRERKIAYFSMEIGLRPEQPVYSVGMSGLSVPILFLDTNIEANHVHE